MTARAFRRFKERVEGAVEFRLRALEVTQAQFLLAGLEMLIRFRDEDRDGIDNRLRRRERCNRRGWLRNDRDRLWAASSSATGEQTGGDRRHDGEVSLPNQ